MVNLRNIHRYLSIIAVIILTVSCRPKYIPSPCFGTFNDFENIKGWQSKNIDNYNSIVFDFGKNSLGCIYLNDNSHKSVFFKEELYKLTNEQLMSVKVYADIKRNFTLMDSCFMVCCITNNKDEVVSFQEYSFKTFQNEKDWVHVSKIFDVRKYSVWDNKLLVYFHNKESNQKVFIDNVGIELYSFPIEN